MGQNRKPNVRYLGILMSDSTPTNSSVSGVAVINKTRNKWGISCIFEHFRKMLTFSHIKYIGFKFNKLFKKCSSVVSFMNDLVQLNGSVKFSILF